MKKKITVLTLIAMVFALGDTAQAQQRGKIPRIGVLMPGSPSAVAARVGAFQQGLRELGYVEGKNIIVEYRYGEGKSDSLPRLASELISLKVDVLVAGGGNQVARAATKATETTPIVMTNVADPVRGGFVASLARPGGNVTGLTSMMFDLDGKRLELIKETVPKVSRIGVLYDPNDPDDVTGFKEMQITARSLAVQMLSLQVRNPEEIEAAFKIAGRERVGALVVLPATLTNTHRKPIVEFAVGNRVPAIYPWPEFVQDGGLMSYGLIYTDLWRRAATYVDKILKGAKPADLPVERATKFELVINLKAAKQIGLTIPPNVLVRADKVIK